MGFRFRHNGASVCHAEDYEFEPHMPDKFFFIRKKTIQENGTLSCKTWYESAVSLNGDDLDGWTDGRIDGLIELLLLL